MTVRELSQLYYLNREIDLNEQRRAELQAQVGAIASPDLSGMPHAPGYNSSKTERLAAKLADLDSTIAEQQVRAIRERDRLEQYINDIDDSQMRTIFRLRFVDGLTWRQVSQKMGGDTKEDTVKKTCYRYLRKG